MRSEKNHYFIEFQPSIASGEPHRQTRVLCREMAEDFVRTMKDWAVEKSWENKIGSMNITVLGQVLISCERDVIELIREQNVVNIASIRQSSLEDRGFQRMATREYRKIA